jgi:hypothetical protein
MLDSVRLWNLVARVPGPVPGVVFHRAGLKALHAGRWETADRLLDRAAREYRRELRVEPIARARAHQMIARARRGGRPDANACLEVERRLYRLPRIERLEPPFELADASELLATWAGDIPAGPAISPEKSTDRAA